MPSKTLTLYLHRETRAHLDQAATHGRTAGAEVRLLAEIHSELAKRHRPELTEGQWAVLMTVTSDHPIDRLKDILTLPFLVDDRVRSDPELARRARVDGEGLAFRLRTMKFADLIGLVAELERRLGAAAAPS